MKCLIRRAIVTDAAGACDVVRRSISELCVEDHQGDQTTIDAWIANKTVPNFESWIRSNSKIALVAEGTSGLVGFGLLNLQGQLALLSVSPVARFQGGSKALLRSIEEEAVDAGLREIRLGSTATARRFYLDCGFSPTGDPSRGGGVTESQPMSKQLEHPERLVAPSRTRLKSPRAGPSSTVIIEFSRSAAAAVRIGTLRSPGLADRLCSSKTRHVRE